MQPTISFITAEETLPLRALVLRPGWNPSDCKNPLDENGDTFHLGARIQNQIVGIASFEKEVFAEIPSTSPYRLRGMAVDPNFRRTGIGRDLILFGQYQLTKRHTDLFWMKARVNAFAFYQSLDFKFWGNEFDIPGIGPHKVMYKHLSPR